MYMQGKGRKCERALIRPLFVVTIITIIRRVYTVGADGN